MPKKRKHLEPHGKGGSNLKDIILGGQDGLVNVLGLVLGVAGGTGDIRTVLIAGLAGTFAESISMAAVAFTSTKAAKEYYLSEVERERYEMKHMPKIEKQEIRDIYKKRGFKGKLLNQVVEKICSNKKVWLDTMMSEELKLSPEDYSHPLKAGIVVGLASVVGSLIPLLAFFLVKDIMSGIYASLIISAIALFITGALKAKVTIGDWRKAGIELMLIGMISAIAAYYVGFFVGKL